MLACPPRLAGAREIVMKKERLASFRKRLLEKHEQLAAGVGRSANYGKDQEDDAIKDLGDQANTAYTRADRRQAAGGAAVRALLHRLPAPRRGRGADRRRLISPPAPALDRLAVAVP
jgi:hypothetical protein